MTEGVECSCTLIPQSVVTEILQERSPEGPRADRTANQLRLERQVGEKQTEPNSALGGAIGYTLKHWEELTLFLRQAGAPLDNNLCERP